MRSVQLNLLIGTFFDPADFQLAQKILIGTLLKNCKIEPFNYICRYIYIFSIFWLVLFFNQALLNFFYLEGFKYIKLILLLGLFN